MLCWTPASRLSHTVVEGVRGPLVGYLRRVGDELAGEERCRREVLAREHLDVVLDAGVLVVEHDLEELPRRDGEGRLLEGEVDRDDPDRLGRASALPALAPRAERRHRAAPRPPPAD